MLNISVTELKMMFAVLLLHTSVTAEDECAVLSLKMTMFRKRAKVAQS